MMLGFFPSAASWRRTRILSLARTGAIPAGGVGINLAIQDAVAAANLLAAKIRRIAARVVGMGFRPEHIEI
jgi:2-polyprenyl-6-methoxyphenol hydroxylase-like FAD-dependent oxidoreductase